MIMMSLFAIGEIPFQKVHLHGMVLDAHGKKMSKSKGNGIDPIDVVEKFGTDAVRLSLLIGNTPGNDMRLSEDKIQSYRNFVTKLWNIGRYIDFATGSKVAQIAQSVQTNQPKPKTDADSWILARLNQTIASITDNINNHNLSAAGETLRDFTWNDFANWYIEVHKIQKNDEVLVYVFQNLLKLWHPFMPFVTEQLWQELIVGGETKNQDDTPAELLMIAQWPTQNQLIAQNTDNFPLIQDIVTTIRNVRSAYKIDAGARIDVTIAGEYTELLEANREIIAQLARTNNLTIQTDKSEIANSISTVARAGTVTVHLSSVIDLEAEHERLTKEIAKARKYADGLSARLANEKFVANAPAQVIQAQRQTLAETETKITELQESLKQLK
jgi:valyl-tRNA synthetase